MIKPVIDIIVLQILDDKARKEFNDDMFMQYYNSTKYVGIALVPIVFIVTGFLIKKIFMIRFWNRNMLNIFTKHPTSMKDTVKIGVRFCMIP